MQTTLATNPLREDVDARQAPEPCALVIYGATGDLTHRKLVPALYNLAHEGQLPQSFAIVGFARRPKTHDQFRAELRDAVAQFSRFQPINPGVWDALAQAIFYHQSDFGDANGYKTLGEFLRKLDAERGTAGNRLFYLATAPTEFIGIIQELGANALAGADQVNGSPPRIIVEKPFGRSLPTAQELNRELSSVFGERQIFRIDHYLGKETVQNILALRFANEIFEPLWNQKYIDHIQITVAESLGVEDRGGYYDKSGALRDMVQNHMMQLLSLVAMEPPIVLEGESIHDEKVKVLRALRPIKPEQVQEFTVRGQYARGSMAGKPVPAYQEEKNVAPGSRTETFVALKLFIDNWRWAGVPFYLRSGKRLARKNSEIAIRFKGIPHRLFGELNDTIDNNVLVMKIQPEEGISLRFAAKVPGPKMHIRSVSMDFNYGTGFGVVSAPAYERLIGDAMRGDATLFTRWDAVETAWNIVMPVLERWQNTYDESFPNYAAGSQGPASSDRLLAADGREWRRI